MILIYKMDNNIFIKEFIEKINNIRDNEFKLFNYNFEEKIIDKKKVNENSMEFKAFQIALKKKAQLEKLKPGNIGKKEYGSDNNGVDILEDDIFNNISNEESNEEIKLDIDLLERDKKMQLINDFLERKNIILEENETKKIEDIIDDTEIVLKKYISISKIYQQIIKISFLKKLENGSYIIDLNKSNVKKSKKYFFK